MPRTKGAKKLVFTEREHELVLAMCAFGIPHVEIAKKLHCSPRSLEKHFKKELQGGKIDAVLTIANCLYKNAQSGNVTAQIFYLKTQGGWKETARTEVVGDNGGPVKLEAARDALETKLARLVAKNEEEPAAPSDQEPSK
jgi:hypothetical protein